MGTVYLATQLSRGRVVALKVLSANLSQDEAFNKRFRREAVLRATPADPHIVPVDEAGESGYGLFIAMRLVDGPEHEGADRERWRPDRLHRRRRRGGRRDAGAGSDP
jgi:serine/threonine protein kinase